MRDCWTPASVRPVSQVRSTSDRTARVLLQNKKGTNLTEGRFQEGTTLFRMDYTAVLKLFLTFSNNETLFKCKEFLKRSPVQNVFFDFDQFPRVIVPKKSVLKCRVVFFEKLKFGGRKTKSRCWSNRFSDSKTLKKRKPWKIFYFREKAPPNFSKFSRKFR